jgi:N-acetylglutamate synthase-like GNAT family acetyltransferase
MGNNFPQITTLKNTPSCFASAVKLIERSFQYPASQSFLIDFAPLMDESNHHNCFVLIDENEKVLAHIGVKERVLRLGDKTFTLAMLGGIAVDEKHRGQGHFQTLIQNVMAEKLGECALFLLWSDQEKLYKKHGFHLCGSQFELPKKNGNCSYTQTKFAALSSIQKAAIKNLYERSFAKTYITLDRTEKNWDLIEKVTSADLFLKEKEGEITDYFFINKGQDLTNIIYEYGSLNDLSKTLQDARSQGNVWMGAALIPTATEQFQFLLALGDSKQFTELVSALTNGKFVLRGINTIKQEVFFDFEGETLMLSIEEFSRGVFGPSPFEELGDIQPLFISGLDSI